MPNKNASSLFATLANFSAHTADVEGFWSAHIKDFVVYHGTNDKAWERIKRDGFLSHTRRFWDDDLYALESLIKKAGWKEGFSSRRDGLVFLTSDEEAGASYAKRSPELWSFFVGNQNWFARNKEGAKESLKYFLAYGYNEGKHLSEVDKVLRLEKDAFSSHSLLERDEVYQAFDIFEKFWPFFAKERPLLHKHIKGLIHLIPIQLGM